MDVKREIKEETEEETRILIWARFNNVIFIHLSKKNSRPYSIKKKRFLRYNVLNCMPDREISSSDFFVIPGSVQKVQWP